MKTFTKLVAVVAIAGLVGVPALAGEKDGGCGHGTQDCLNYMAKNFAKKGWLGIEGERQEGGYFKISKVVDNSPAQEAGLKSGDVIVAYNGHEIGSIDESTWKELEKEMLPGKAVNYTVKRGGSKKDVTATLASMPDNVVAQWVGRHMLEHAAVDVAAN